MRLLVSTANFGLGSAGKLASILRELPSDTELIVHGSELGAAVWERTISQAVVHRQPTGAPIVDALDHGVDAALLVLDSDGAGALAASGVPVVYVDSLPFLWTDADVIPTQATRYAAQQTPELPASCWGPLRRVERLSWVEAIVPTVAAWDGAAADGVVVNLGGVSSWVRQAEDIAYPAVVLPPVLSGIRAQLGEVSVTVTTSRDALPTVRAVLASCGEPARGARAIAADHDQFTELVARSRLVVTSPGLTTILETGAAGVPSIVLPPQNLSQFHNFRAVQRVAPSSVVPWPAETLRWEVIEASFGDGEDAVVSRIYGGIDALAGDDAAASRLTAAVERALAPGDLPCPGAALLAVVGRRGAAQVARMVLDLSASSTDPTRGSPTMLIPDAPTRSVFVAGPFMGAIDPLTGTVVTRERERLLRVIEWFESSGWLVYNAHRREQWGQSILPPDVCTELDYNEIADADLFVAFPGVPASPGTHIEVGWASAMDKPIVLLVEDVELHTFLIRGLHTVARVEYVQTAGSTDLVGDIEAAMDRLGLASVQPAVGG